MSKTEWKMLKSKAGVKFDPSIGGGIPGTTLAFTPKNADHAKMMTGPRSADFMVDLNVSGLKLEPRRTTKMGLAEYSIMSNLTKSNIIAHKRLS